MTSSWDRWPAPDVVSGRRLLAGLALGASLAGGLGAAAWVATGLVAPRAVGGATFTVGLVALGYAALIGGLVLSVGTRRFLHVAGYRRPAVGDLGAALLGWLAWLVTTAACYFAWGALATDPLGPLRDMLHHASDVGRLADAGPAVIVFIVVRVGFLSAAFEESFFRGFLQPWLRRRLTAPIAIAITSVVFALAHGYPVIYPAVLVFGLVAGVLRERRTTTVTLFMHVLTDFTLTVTAVALLGAG